jgi:hypothetical protein
MNNLDSWKLALVCWIETWRFYFRKYVTCSVRPEDEMIQAMIRLLAKANYEPQDTSEYDRSEVDYWINRILEEDSDLDFNLDARLKETRKILVEDFIVQNKPVIIDDHFGDVDYWLRNMEGDDYTVEGLISRGIYHSEIARYRVRERQNTFYLRAPVDSLMECVAQQQDNDSDDSI